MLHSRKFAQFTARTIMKRLLVLTTLLLSFALLVACGDDELSADTPVNLATLPKTIDVRTAAAIKDRDEVVLIDVREQWEYDEAHIPGVTLIPMSEFESRVSELPQDKTVVLTCRSGNRSGQAYDYLTNLGYDNVHNMRGGILAWESAGLEVKRGEN